MFLLYSVDKVHIIHPVEVKHDRMQDISCILSCLFYDNLRTHHWEMDYHKIIGKDKTKCVQFLLKDKTKDY